MALRLPENKWELPNNSDKFGNVYYVKNIDFDLEGYARLSPRSVVVMDGDENGDFGIPIIAGRQAVGHYQVATSSDANFEVNITTQRNTFGENSGANEPTLTTNSHAVWYQGLWHASTATAILSRPASGGASQDWTSRITGLTTGKRHFLATFPSNATICVTNGNVVKQYDSSYADTPADLTISSDYETIGLAYNNSRMAVATRLTSSSSLGQDEEARLFIWDGADTSALADPAVGSDAIMYVVAYKTSFAILTRAGELLLYNGGGFTLLGRLPFYFTGELWQNEQDTSILGASPMTVDGDVIYINLGLRLDDFGVKNQEVLENTPSGVWCYDPAVGLYHRWSPSLSRAYVNSVNSGDVNTTTDVLTVSAGVYGAETIPTTGNIVRATDDPPAPLVLNQDYYIIKVSSTEFSVATTKENALLGTKINLTGQPTSRAYFWMYELKDYGQSLYDTAGSVTKVGDTTTVYKDVLIGGRFIDTDGLSFDALCMVVPRLENRGYIVTPKIYSSQNTDTTQSLVVKFKPLKDTDSIVIKQRNRDVLGLPVSSSATLAVWTSPTECYTSQDLSEAKTYLDSGGKLEFEILAGVGGNQNTQILEINEDSGVYSIVLEDEVIGVSSGLKSEFIIQNWEEFDTITSTRNDEGFLISQIGNKGKWSQFKIELRGSEVTLEAIDVVSEPFQQSI